MSAQIPGRQIRLLMITNERRPGTAYGLRDEYMTMAHRGEIESFNAIAPAVIAGSSSGQAAAAEMHEIARADQPERRPGSVSETPWPRHAVGRAMDSVRREACGLVLGRGRLA